MATLREIIDNSKYAVFFGGAGVSTASNIPDFRGKNGIYNTENEWGLPPEIIISHTFFTRRTKDFYDYYKKYMVYPSAVPNVVHIALARLEKLPLEQLIGNSFSSLFNNMNSKWLPAYERATLYGEVLEVIDYSPEIDTPLKVIYFPTFKGHCGCILFDIEEIKLIQTSDDAPGALMQYLGTALKEIERR